MIRYDMMRYDMMRYDTISVKASRREDWRPTLRKPRGQEKTQNCHILCILSQSTYAFANVDWFLLQREFSRSLYFKDFSKTPPSLLSMQLRNRSKTGVAETIHTTCNMQWQNWYDDWEFSMLCFSGREAPGQFRTNSSERCIYHFFTL